MTDPARTMGQAAEQVRQFNHQTIITDDGWEYAPQAYRAIGATARLARMLPQAIEQTLLPVDRTHQQGRLTVDSDSSADKAVTLLRQILDAAARTARDLAEVLDLAHQTSALLGVDTRGLPESED